MHQSTSPSIPTVIITTIIMFFLQNHPFDIINYIVYNSIIVIIVVTIGVILEEFIYNNYSRIIIKLITLNIIINIVIRDTIYNHANEVHYHNISILVISKEIRRSIYIRIIKKDIYLNNDIITDTTSNVNINDLKIDIYKVNIILYCTILTHVTSNFNILYFGIIALTKHFINYLYTLVTNIINSQKISYYIFNMNIAYYSHVNTHLCFNTIINNIYVYFNMVIKINNKNNIINLISDIVIFTTFIIYLYVFNNKINLISLIFRIFTQNLIYIDFFHDFINHL